MVTVINIVIMIVVNIVDFCYQVAYSEHYMLSGIYLMYIACYQYRHIHIHIHI